MACVPSEDSDKPGHAQADLSLRWAHSHFIGFVVRRLISVLSGEFNPPSSHPTPPTPSPSFKAADVSQYLSLCNLAKTRR